VWFYGGGDHTARNLSQYIYKEEKKISGTRDASASRAPVVVVVVEYTLNAKVAAAAHAQFISL
jgi:hypothetical protein